MKTRTIEEVKVFRLRLNPMTANFESRSIVALCFDKDELFAWYEKQKVEPYNDGRWRISFNTESKLANYNPYDDGGFICNEHCGIFESWETIEDLNGFYYNALNSLGGVEIPELIGEIQNYVS